MIAETCQILMNLNSRYPDYKSFKVFMFGTSIDAIFTDVLGVLTALHDKEWENDPTHEIYSHREIEDRNVITYPQKRWGR